MKIYTKKGDAGSTSILGPKKYLKNDLRITAIGEIDELNAYIGLIYASIDLQKSTLFNTLNNLFIIGSQLASEEQGKYKIPEIKESDILELETQIDAMEAELTAMTHFILPTGDVFCSQIHIARAVCRRAERSLVSLNNSELIPAYLLPYLNRLSDYLFVLARFYCYKSDISEIKWIPNK